MRIYFGAASFPTIEGRIVWTSFSHSAFVTCVTFHSKTLTDQPPVHPSTRPAACQPPPFRLSVAQTKICLHAQYKYRTQCRCPATACPPFPHLNAPVSKEHNRCRYTVSHTTKTLVKHGRRRRRRRRQFAKQQQPIKIVIHRAIGGRISHLNRNLNSKSQFNIYSTFAVHFWLSTDDAGIHWETSALGGQCSPIGWATRRRQPSGPLPLE